MIRLCASCSLAALHMILAACGHGTYTRAFRDDAIANMARVRAATGYDVALQQFQSGDLQRAMATINACIAMDTDVAPGHMLHGRILFELGRSKQAYAAFNRAAALAPNDPEIDYSRGIVLERMGRLEDALGQYRSAMARGADRPHYRLAVAETLVELGRLDDAWTLLDSPDGDVQLHAGFRQTLGHIALMRDDVDLSLSLFAEAVILGPGDPVLLEDLARAEIAAGRFSGAEETLRRLTSVSYGDNRRDLLLLHASSLLELDRPVQARRILLDLTQTPEGQGDIEAWVRLIDVALVLGDDHLLRRVASHLIATAPERYEGYLAMSMWHRTDGDRDAALHTVERAIARADNDPTPRCFKLVLLRQ